MNGCPGFARHATILRRSCSVGRSFNPPSAVISGKPASQKRERAGSRSVSRCLRRRSPFASRGARAPRAAARAPCPAAGAASWESLRAAHLLVHLCAHSAELSFTLASADRGGEPGRSRSPVRRPPAWGSAGEAARPGRAREREAELWRCERRGVRGRCAARSDSHDAAPAAGHGARAAGSCARAPRDAKGDLRGDTEIPIDFRALAFLRSGLPPK